MPPTGSNRTGGRFVTSFLWVALSSQHGSPRRSTRGGQGGQTAMSNAERTLWSEDVALVSS